MKHAAVKLLQRALSLLALGALVMLGVRAVEYLIPRPPSIHLLCLMEDNIVKCPDEMKQRVNR